jgi:hypothetical protein
MTQHAGDFKNVVGVTTCNGKGSGCETLGIDTTWRGAEIKEQAHKLIVPIVARCVERCILSGIWPIDGVWVRGHHSLDNFSQIQTRRKHAQRARQTRDQPTLEQDLRERHRQESHL